MAVHNFVNGDCYTVKILCPGITDFVKMYQSKLALYLTKNSAAERAHIGLKYLGYEKDYEEDYIVRIASQIKEIADKYLPIEIEIKGLDIFSSRPEWPSKSIVFLQVKLTKSLKNFHEELIENLKNKSDEFILTEGKNYTPHITLGEGKEEVRKLIEDINKSDFLTPQKFLVKNFGMRLKNDKIFQIK